jgi:hypothetical protein
MTTSPPLLRPSYDAFNRRDLDALLGLRGVGDVTVTRLRVHALEAARPRA